MDKIEVDAKELISQLTSDFSNVEAGLRQENAMLKVQLKTLENKYNSTLDKKE